MLFHTIQLPSAVVSAHVTVNVNNINLCMHLWESNPLSCNILSTWRKPLRESISEKCCLVLLSVDWHCVGWVAWGSMQSLGIERCRRWAPWRILSLLSTILGATRTRTVQQANKYSSLFLNDALLYSSHETFITPPSNLISNVFISSSPTPSL